MIRELAYGITGLVLLAYGLDFLFGLGDDPQEPPRIRPKVPLIGHLLGLMKAGPSYYSQTSNATDAEIYTLGVFNFKIYISAASRLLPVISKQSRNLSFRPFLQIVARKHGDATPETHEIFGGTVVDDLSQSVKLSLAPGPHLDELNLRMGKRVLVDIDALFDTKTGRGRQIYLLDWSRHAVIQASSCAVYGEEHPFLDPEVEKAFWKWMTYLTAHLVGWLDIFGKGYAAREKVFKEYIKYSKILPERGSHLAKDHHRVLQEAGISELDNAKQAAIFTIAAFSNSAPTLHWTLWEMFSRPELLTEVRQELSAQAISGSKADGFVLDVAALKSRCPLILSVFQETQRTRHINPSFRKVMADTLLDNKYLLKAGRYLQMPGNPILTSPGIWGPTASEFDPYRFVPKTGVDRDALPASGFVAWGAPPYLCPARQFATTEILIVAALLAIRADLRPISGGWEKSPALNFADLSTLSPPKRDVAVDVSVRDEWVGAWTVKMGESKSRVSLASG